MPTTSPDDFVYRIVARWFIHAALIGLLAVLSWIGHNIQEMSHTLTIVATRVDEHERRLIGIEEEIRRLRLGQLK